MDNANRAINYEPESTERGFFTTGLDVSELDMFSVDQVQLNIGIGAAKIVDLKVESNILVLALSDARLVFLDLANPSEPQTVEVIDSKLQQKLQKKKSSAATTTTRDSPHLNIHKVFLDPLGNHVIIAGTNGENYYCHRKLLKFHNLLRSKGNVIECVGWSPFTSSSSTKEILVGTKSGVIFETYIDSGHDRKGFEERYFRSVLKLQSAPVCGIEITTISDADKSSKPQQTTSSDCIVLITYPTTMYSWQISSNPRLDQKNSTLYSSILTPDGAIERQFSASKSNPDLSVSSTKYLYSDAFKKSFGILTANGILSGPLLEGIEIAKIVPYSLFDAVPSHICLSQGHIILSSRDTIFAYSMLSEKVVFQQKLDLRTDQFVKGLTIDRSMLTIWAFTDSLVFEVVVTDEHRDLWRHFLNQSNFEMALKYANDGEQRDIVNISRGEDALKRKDYKSAANYLANTSKPFEDIVLIFVDAREEEALTTFLWERLKGLSRDMVIQRTLLVTWLLEIILSRLDKLDDEMKSWDTNESPNNNTRVILLKQFDELITKYKRDLDKNTTYETFAMHDREEELLKYATNINDRAFILNYYIEHSRWHSAIEMLKNQDNIQQFYEHSYVLLLNSPNATIDLWILRTELDPKLLLPALFAYNSHFDVPYEKNQAYRYLRHVIKNIGSKDSLVHSTYISILAKLLPEEEEEPLLEYFKSPSYDGLYDRDFALRTCTQLKKFQCCVQIYSSMGLYEQAVSTALDHNMTQLAASVVDKLVGDNVLQKQLWMQIATIMISCSSEPTHDTVKYLLKSGVLSIDDILPLLPDSALVSDIKEEILRALETRNDAILQLSRDMDEAEMMTDGITAAITDFRSRFSVLKSDEQCDLCGKPLIIQQFYVFPCHHTFHGLCLLDTVRRKSTPLLVKKIEDLQNQLSKVARGPKRDILSESFDNIIGEDCVLCGSTMVQSIDNDFEITAAEVAAWKI